MIFEHLYYSMERHLQFSSVQSLSRVRLFGTPWIIACQALCPSPTPRVYPNSCSSSWRCHPAISSSVVPFSSCPQSLPASESFPMSQLFAWGAQSIGVSALASVLPKNTQDWFQPYSKYTSHRSEHSTWFIGTYTWECINNSGKQACFRYQPCTNNIH